MMLNILHSIGYGMIGFVISFLAVGTLLYVNNFPNTKGNAVMVYAISAFFGVITFLLTL